MTTWCCITPTRAYKVRPIMESLAAGWPGGRVAVGDPEPPVEDDFIVWGQVWLAEDMIRRALKVGQRFFQIDNGCWGRVSPGYYRFLDTRPSPVFVRDEALRAERRHLRIPMRPWRTTGKHILLAEPGLDLGKAFGLSFTDWYRKTLEKLRGLTDRKIVTRPRLGCSRPLADDLEGAWALVTHSSNVAVDAVLRGVPVFVEPTSMAAPVGNLSLKYLEDPAMPDRGDWMDSLLCQQFSLDEMRSGAAYHFLRSVRRQNDLDFNRESMLD